MLCITDNKRVFYDRQPNIERRLKEEISALEPNGERYTIQNNELILTDYMVSDGFIHYYKRVE